MLIRIGTVVACVFASAVLAGEPTLKHWASLAASFFCYAGAEFSQHQAKRKREKEQEAFVKEVRDLRLAESALRDDCRKKQEIIDGFHKRDRDSVVRKMDEVNDTCRDVIRGIGQK